MAVKERSQIKGTDAQIKAFAGHNGVLAFATDTKSLHVLSGTAGTTTEFLPSNKVATKTELDGKLSLSGGTMTGDVELNRNIGFIGKADKNGYLALSGGNEISTGGAGSAILWLSGGDASSPINRPGEFSLEASKGTYGQSGFSSVELKGKPDGSLTWGGHNVISVVAESYTFGSRYRKYSDGWIEQGGDAYFQENEATLVITFPIAFSTGDYVITFCTNYSPLNFPAWLSNKDTTNFSVSRSGNVGGMGVWWYAWGK